MSLGDTVHHCIHTVCSWATPPLLGILCLLRDQLESLKDIIREEGRLTATSYSLGQQPKPMTSNSVLTWRPPWGPLHFPAGPQPGAPPGKQQLLIYPEEVSSCKDTQLTDDMGKDVCACAHVYAHVCWCVCMCTGMGIHINYLDLNLRLHAY